MLHHLVRRIGRSVVGISGLRAEHRQNDTDDPEQPCPERKALNFSIAHQCKDEIVLRLIAFNAIDINYNCR